MKILDLSKNEPPRNFGENVFRRAASIAACELNKYPVVQNESLQANLQKYCGKQRSALLFKGIDDCLDKFLQQKRHLKPVVFTPTFPGFLERFNAAKLEFDQIELGFGCEIEDQVASLDRNHILFLANPRNPTGTYLDIQSLRKITSCVGCAFIDEAYIHFSGKPSFEHWAKNNTFVYTSFSKAYCLTAARLGMLSGDTIEIQKLKRRYSGFAQFSNMDIALVEESFESDIVATCGEAVIRARKEFVSRLASSGISSRESFGNFVLLETGSETEKIACELLEKSRIKVRTLFDAGIPDWVRVTVPDPNDIDRVLEAIENTFGNERKYKTIA